MAAPQNFRTAFHGFNREDVVRYIEYLGAKHAAQINELNNELDFLRNKTEAHALSMVTPERLFEAEIQRDEYKAQLDEQAIVISQLEEKCAALEQGAPVVTESPESAEKILRLEEKCAALEAQLAEALAVQVPEIPAALPENDDVVTALQVKCTALEAIIDSRNASAAQQEARISALEQELADARAAKEQAETAQNFHNAGSSDLEIRCAALEKELADAISAKIQAESAWNANTINAAKFESRCATLERELADALAAKQLIEAEKETARKYNIEQELEAYRRAERMERVAKERADQIYFKANGVLADATVKVDEATAQISGLTDKVMEQLHLLQSAVLGSKQALSDAAATMYTLRPEAEQK